MDVMSRLKAEKAHYKDFVGFTYDGIHSSQLGLKRISGGDRYNQNLSPAFTDRQVQVAGADGSLIFGSDINRREFTIEIAYDDLSEEQFHFMEKLFAKKKMVSLIFDETPYKQYWVKPTNPPQFRYICFDEGYRRNRVYKGEGTLNFVCYEGFGRSIINAKDEIDVDRYLSADFRIEMAPNTSITVPEIARVLKDEYDNEVPYFEVYQGLHLNLANSKTNNDIYGRDNDYLPKYKVDPIQPYDTEIPVDVKVQYNHETKVIEIIYNNLRNGFPTEEQKALLKKLAVTDGDPAREGGIVINYINGTADEEESEEVESNPYEYGDTTGNDYSAFAFDVGQTPDITSLNKNIETFYNSAIDEYELMATYLQSIVEISSKTGKITAFDKTGDFTIKAVATDGREANLYISVSNNIKEYDQNGEEIGAANCQPIYLEQFGNFYEWCDSIDLPETKPTFRAPKRRELSGKQKELGINSLSQISNIGHYDTPINFWVRAEQLNKEFTIYANDQKLSIDLTKCDTQGKDLYINSELRVLQLGNANEDKIDELQVYNRYITAGDFIVLHQFEDLDLSSTLNENDISIKFWYRFV